MDVGSLNVDLRMNMQKFQRSLSASIRSIEKIGSQMEKSFGEEPRKEIDKTEDRFQRFTWTARGYIKDTSKVITGILISQGFYKLLSTIEDATASLFRFNNELQRSAISFKLMLGNAKEAGVFIELLQDFAADTPFAFEQAQKTAQMLLAYGFPAESILYSMQTILDTAAVRGGGADAISGIARAIGQMMTKVKVEYQEVRQLAEWGVPVQEIWQEKLGLTPDQIQSIGDQNVAGAEAALALLEGLRERYGGASEEISRTTLGLVEKISDNLKIIGNEVFTPVFENIRERLQNTADRLEELRELVRSEGIGGLLRELSLIHI